MKLILRLTKYLFIMVISIFIIIVFIFVYYSKKLDFKIPDMVDVQIYDNSNNVYLTLNNVNKQSYVKLNDVSQNIIDAVISIEDKKFYQHKGIDVMRIAGALVANAKANGIAQGASTITQQYARMLYLNTDQNMKRKTEEILIAMNLETKYSKEEILEGYLNSIYFYHGIYGIKDACRFFFNKEPSEVTVAEAATLAAMLKSAYYYSPIVYPESNKSRKNLVIDELYKDGKITSFEAEEAKNEDVQIYGKIDITDDYNAPYYQDIIIKELKKLNIIYKYDVKSLKVYTTLDLELNKTILDALEKYYPKDSNFQVAAFAMNPQNGNVLSVIGGTNYTNSPYNRAIESMRQPGSSIKPFLYYTALNNGFTPITTFRSSQTEFYVDGHLYSPANFADIYPNQDVTMAYAIATSDNIYAVKTHLFLGTDALVNTLREFGFTTPIQNTPSLALGTSEVKLSEITTGYARFANLGRDVSPIYITKITDEKGNVLYTKKDKSKQVYNQKNAYILTETLTNVFDNHLSINISTTGAPISSMLQHRFAAKTGSTDYDGWIIGYNSEIVFGIWTGYDDSSVLDTKQTKFIKYMWADVVEKYMDRLGTNGWYGTQDNVITLKVNPTTGKLAKDGEYAKELFFDIDNVPWYIYEPEIPKEGIPKEDDKYPETDINDLPESLWPFL